MGERDDTLPPEYRPTEEDLKVTDDYICTLRALLLQRVQFELILFVPIQIMSILPECHLLEVYT